VRRSLVAGAAAAALAAAAAAVWVARGRGAADPSEPLPYDTTVELQFPADEDGEAETWVVSKRRTTREESLGAAALPAPDPPDPEREPSESARVLDDLALDAWRGGNVERALELYDQALAADPDDWVAHAQAGRLRAMMQDHERAGALLERAAALAPDDPQRWLDLQTYYERTQDLARAWQAAERARELLGDRAVVQDWNGFWVPEGSAEAR
jgi:tetratricopeptide (TPR) repeat protein